MRNLIGFWLLLAGAMAASAAEKSPGPTPKPPAATTDAELRAVIAAKVSFMATAVACEKPGTCDPKSASKDPALVREIDSRERDYVAACRACATEEACEADRALIRSGRGKRSVNPCLPAGPGKASRPAK